MNFEVESLRHCVEGYFRKFTIKTEAAQRIQQHTDGVVLKAQEFEPFVSVQVSNDGAMQPIGGGHIHHAPTWREVTWEQHRNEVPVESQRTFEAHQSLEDLFEDIASGQFEAETPRRLVHEPPTTIDAACIRPLVTVAAALILCILLRAPFFWRHAR